MRMFEDPLHQERLCDLLRTGLSIPETLRAMGPGFNSTGLREERERDQQFDEKVFLAQASAFNPTLRALIRQSLEDPPTPESLRAAELVVRHYNKALDREHDHAKINHAADKQRELIEATQTTPTLTTPAQVAQLIEAIKEARHGDTTQDGDTPRLPSQQDV